METGSEERRCVKMGSFWGIAGRKIFRNLTLLTPMSFNAFWAAADNTTYSSCNIIINIIIRTVMTLEISAWFVVRISHFHLLQQCYCHGYNQHTQSFQRLPCICTRIRTHKPVLYNKPIMPVVPHSSLIYSDVGICQ